jgi:hypothetical protein
MALRTYRFATADAPRSLFRTPAIAAGLLDPGVLIGLHEPEANSNHAYAVAYGLFLLYGNAKGTLVPLTEEEAEAAEGGYVIGVANVARLNPQLVLLDLAMRLTDWTAVSNGASSHCDDPNVRDALVPLHSLPVPQPDLVSAREAWVNAVHMLAEGWVEEKWMRKSPTLTRILDKTWPMYDDVAFGVHSVYTVPGRVALQGFAHTYVAAGDYTKVALQSSNDAYIGNPQLSAMQTKVIGMISTYAYRLGGTRVLQPLLDPDWPALDTALKGGRAHFHPALQYLEMALALTLWDSVKSQNCIPLCDDAVFTALFFPLPELPVMGGNSVCAWTTAARSLEAKYVPPELRGKVRTLEAIYATAAPPTPKIDVAFQGRTIVRRPSVDEVVNGRPITDLVDPETVQSIIGALEVARKLRMLITDGGLPSVIDCSIGTTGLRSSLVQVQLSLEGRIDYSSEALSITVGDKAGWRTVVKDGRSGADAALLKVIFDHIVTDILTPLMTYLAEREALVGTLEHPHSKAIQNSMTCHGITLP